MPKESGQKANWLELESSEGHLTAPSAAPVGGRVEEGRTSWVASVSSEIFGFFLDIWGGPYTNDISTIFGGLGRPSLFRNLSRFDPMSAPEFGVTGAPNLNWELCSQGLAPIRCPDL